MPSFKRELTVVCLLLRAILKYPYYSKSSAFRGEKLIRPPKQRSKTLEAEGYGIFIETSSNLALALPKSAALKSLSID